MSDFYIYLWTNQLNGKRYVGKGRGRRDYEHLKPGRSSALGAAIRKYGPENFCVEHLVEGLEEEAAYALEMLAIRWLGSQAPLGYNLTTGGEGLRSPSAATRKKLADSKKGRPGTRRGHKNSPEHNSRIAAAHTGRKLSAEHNAKFQAGRASNVPWNKGRPNPRSPESIERQRQSMLETMKRKRAARCNMIS